MIDKLQKLLQFKTLQSKIFFSFLAFLIMPFCLLTYLLGKPLERTIHNKINESIQSTLTLTAMNVEDVMGEMMAAVTVISMNENLIKVLKSPERFNQYDRLRFTDQVMKTAYGTYLTEAENFVTIMDFKGNIYSSWARKKPYYGEFSKSPWYSLILKSKGRFLWLVHQPGFIPGESKAFFTVAKLINEHSFSRDYEGLVMVSIYADDLLKLLNKASPYQLSETYLISKDGPAIVNAAGEKMLARFQAEPEYQRIFTEKNGHALLRLGAERVNLNFGSLRMNDWKIVQLIPEQVVFKEIHRMQRINIIIMAGMLLLFVTITISISYRITMPMKKLRQKMHHFSDDSLEFLAPDQSFEEVAKLIETYNKMITKIKDLLAKVELEHKQKEMIRFRALQAQINPHFILNTLNNIKWMAYLSRANEVGEMISALGAIMEASLGRDEDVITLAQEVEYVQNYVYLQKIRYNEKIEASYDIPATLSDCQVVKFILQPLVENCIGHGFDKLRRKGRIKISARQIGNDIAITVQDNGNGMEEAKLEQLRRSLADGVDPKMTGRIGIKNIHERLRLTYGAEYGLTIDSEKKQGMTVCILLPLRRREERKGAVNDQSIDCG